MGTTLAVTPQASNGAYGADEQHQIKIHVVGSCGFGLSAWPLKMHVSGVLGALGSPHSAVSQPPCVAHQASTAGSAIGPSHFSIAATLFPSAAQWQT